jgi:hypothetical protein
MTLARVFDASTPPPQPVTGCAGVAGYIGRPGFTPNVWGIGAWERFDRLTQFPVWVPDLSVHAGTEAEAIMSALNIYGWGRGGMAVMVDYETSGAAEAAWHSDLSEALGSWHFDAVAYGSLSTVMSVAAAHVWVAAWDGLADIPAGQTVHGHQYASYPEFDLSVFDPWLMERGLSRG